VTAIDRRIGFLFAGFVMLLALAVARAGYLGLFRSGELRAAAAQQQVQIVTTPAPRGEITDRDGVVLALSESADEVIADPLLIRDPRRVAKQIAPLVGRPEPAVLRTLTKPNTGYSAVAYDVPSARATALENMEIDGLSFKPVQQRVYPRSWTASQVLGWVGSAGTGLAGIEDLYDRQLSGHNGVTRIVNDANGQTIAVDRRSATVPGKTVRLTIDAALQDYVERVLAGVGAEYSPKSATAIVMNPDNGEILSLANWPRIDDNDVGGAPEWATEDWATGLTYEPGSTFKAITVAGALQEGLVTPSTTVTIPPYLLYPGSPPIYDAEHHGTEQLTVAQILQVSSNIGADLIGRRLGASRFNYWVHRFGFGSPTGIDLPGEERGIILPLSRYTGSSMGTLPFGQGEAVTPIQMATAYSAIANGGILRPPRIVASVGGVPTKVPAGQRVISPQTAAEIRDMLRGVLADGGTASGAWIKGYDLSGKTGTANVAIAGKYSKTKYVASFIGMVPASDPKLVVAVVVNEPNSQIGIYGGSVAAPAFQKIVGWAVPYFGIDPCPAPCPASAQSPVTPLTP
jgi:cell division protein FtsI (penicillin-binding protein 3)